MQKQQGKEQIGAYTERQIREADQREYPRHKSIKAAENGSMVNDMEDLKQLGEDMEEMHTSSEDHKQGVYVDPEQ